jgi:hypothetical protein
VPKGRLKSTAAIGDSSQMREPGVYIFPSLRVYIHVQASPQVKSGFRGTREVGSYQLPQVANTQTVKRRVTGVGVVHARTDIHCPMW